MFIPSLSSICYQAKFPSSYSSLSHCTGILECQVLDVGVAAFLLDPDDLPSSYPHLLARFSIPIPGKVCTKKYMQLFMQPQSRFEKMLGIVLISLDKQTMHGRLRKWWAAVYCEEDHD